MGRRGVFFSLKIGGGGGGTIQKPVCSAVVKRRNYSDIVLFLLIRADLRM
jgi:hypothetical protein